MIDKENFKIYFNSDLQIIKGNDEKDFWVYSPKNHRVYYNNIIYLPIIKFLINQKGIINLKKARKQLKIEKSLLKEQLFLLLKSEVFFKSNKKLSKINKEFKNILKKIDQKRKKEIDKISINTAYIHMTRRCNFNCVYCYNSHLEKNITMELSTKEWINIIKKLANNGLEKINITGGEPLLRKDLENIVDKANNLGIKVDLLTNGSLLNLKRLKKMENKLNKVIMSFDSFDKKIQSKNRNEKGYSNIIDIIEYFSKYNPKKLIMRAVINNNNIENVKRYKEILNKKYKIKNIKFVVFIPNNLEEVALVPDRSVIKNIEEIIEKDQFDESLNHKVPFKYYGCGGGLGIIAVDVNGDIYPCQSFLGYDKFKHCNILESNWKEEMKKSKQRTILSMLNINKKKECNKCNFRYLCGGGCPANSYRIYNSIFEKNHFQCDLLKKEAVKRLKNYPLKEIKKIK